MFYYIKGNLSVLTPAFAVIDAGGVGYKLTISTTTFGYLSQNYSEEEAVEAKLFSYLSVREDGVELFGFFSEAESEAFKLLTSVSGVGPKAAMAILSVFTPEEFAYAVYQNDTKGISKANGIGAKTAARIVLELHDKITKTKFDTAITVSPTTASRTVSASNKGILNEAQEALVTLGYNKNKASAVLQEIDPSIGLEEIIKLALKKLMQ
ncbi:MAG: Holliday junction branch migration protein RuvA [Clostridia bacterium]|nr:Holliday junction branch migration protein RuvA [Clostridia bacterium]